MPVCIKMVEMPRISLSVLHSFEKIVLSVRLKHSTKRSEGLAKPQIRRSPHTDVAARPKTKSSQPCRVQLLYNELHCRYVVEALIHLVSGFEWSFGE